MRGGVVRWAVAGQPHPAQDDELLFSEWAVSLLLAVGAGRAQGETPGGGGADYLAPSGGFSRSELMLCMLCYACSRFSACRYAR